MTQKITRTTLLSAGLFAALIGLSVPAQANYTIGRLNNQYDQAITYNIPVQPQQSLKKHHGSFSITVPDRGVIQFTDIGDKKAFGCFARTWGVLIRYQGQSWGFYYEGDGKMDLTITPNGDLRIRPVNGELFDSGACSTR